MFPLIAIGGVIGAVMSIAKGASWVADQLDSSPSGSVGGKSDATAQADAKAGSFDAALAAQTAGQALPASLPVADSVPVASAVTAPAMIPQLHGTDYDSLARMKAGMLAYSHLGAHPSDHGKSGKAQHGESPVTAS